MQFVVFEKFTSAYYTKWQEKSCHILLIIYIKKQHRKVRALFVIYSRVTTLHSCYMRLHSFSANKKRVLFSRNYFYIIKRQSKVTFYLMKIRWKTEVFFTDTRKTRYSVTTNPIIYQFILLWFQF